MFKHLDTFSYSLCDNYQLHAGANLMVEVIKRHVQDDPFVDRQIAGMQSETDQIEDYMGTDSRSPMTPEMRQSREQTVKALQLLHGTLEGMRKVALEPLKQQAAVPLLAILALAGPNLGRKANERLSTGLVVILKELKSPQAVQNIQVTGVGGMVADLEAKYAGFKASHQQKVIVDAQLVNPSLTPARADLGYRLNALLTHIDANHTDGIGGGAELIKELNEVIGEIMAKVHARLSRRENGEAAEKAGS
jgi:hypothetical protein